MAVTIPAIAIPGQRLAPATAYALGPGTHIQSAFICASIAGPVIVDQPSDPKSKAPSKLSVSRVPRAAVPDITVLKVAGDSQSVKSRKDKFNTLPAVDSIVLARVTRVQKRQATLSILVVVDDDNQSAAHKTPTTAAEAADITALITTASPEAASENDIRFQAIIRKEDVRAVEKDRVVMDDMFRVGDIVRGVVISLGDQSYYYLSTAKNEFGVVMARSESGNMMFPASWKEMKDSVTGAGEPRKVARPF